MFKTLMVIGFLFSALGFASSEITHTHTINGRTLVQPNAKTTFKLYLQEDMLEITSEGLYLMLEDSRVQVPAIHSDSKGVYVTNAKWGVWYCKRGHPNPPWNLVCPLCRL